MIDGSVWTCDGCGVARELPGGWATVEPSPPEEPEEGHYCPYCCQIICPADTAYSVAGMLNELELRLSKSGWSTTVLAASHLAARRFDGVGSRGSREECLAELHAEVMQFMTAIGCDLARIAFTSAVKRVAGLGD